MSDENIAYSSNAFFELQSSTRKKNFDIILHGLEYEAKYAFCQFTKTHLVEMSLEIDSLIHYHGGP